MSYLSKENLSTLPIYHPGDMTATVCLLLSGRNHRTCQLVVTPGDIRIPKLEDVKIKFSSCHHVLLNNAASRLPGKASALLTHFVARTEQVTQAKVQKPSPTQCSCYKASAHSVPASQKELARPFLVDTLMADNMICLLDISFWMIEAASILALEWHISQLPPLIAHDK